MCLVEYIFPIEYLESLIMRPRPQYMSPCYKMQRTLCAANLARYKGCYSCVVVVVVDDDVATTNLSREVLDRKQTNA